MKTYPKTGKENTADAVTLAVKEAKERGLDLLMATTGGDSVYTVLAEKEKQGYEGKIIAVTHAYGFREKNQNELSEECRKDLQQKGVQVLTGTHALSAGERGISSVFKGNYPLELVAQTLRMFGQGTKVCAEIALMAADQGAVREGEPILCLGGTGRGEDTVIVLTPAASNHLFELKINEILAKPSLYE